MHAVKKHSTKIIVGIIVAAILSAMLYLVLRPEQASTPSDGSKTTSSGTQQNGDATPPATAKGAYVDYSEETFHQAEGRRILFFYAPWCPQCRALEASIEESTIPGGVTIFKVDYDSNQALREKYGVTIQTSLVEVDANGNEVKKFVAYDEPSYGSVAVAFGL